MSYRHYGPAGPRLFGYDPFSELAADHLARLVDFVVEEAVKPKPLPIAPGGPRFDPRLCVKVLVYGYATGIRSSRQLERMCDESLPYLFLTRGDTPSYRTLCTARLQLQAEIEAAFVGLFAIGQQMGMNRMGRLAIDSTKLRANASAEAVLRQDEYEEVRQELERILAEAAETDEREDRGNNGGRPGDTRLGQVPDPEQMRDILRRVRSQRTRIRQPAIPTSSAAFTASTEPTPQAPSSPKRRYTAQMRKRITAALAALEQAQQEKRKHLCLTDPHARMMAGGTDHRIRECHSFEVAVDTDAGLLVAGQSTQEPNDNARLSAVITAAKANEPHGVTAATADSGYYAGDELGRLTEQGIDLCVPDSLTACDLHRGEPVGTARSRTQKAARFEYDPSADSYLCEAGHRLAFTQEREQGGQQVRVYIAQADCQACERAADCLSAPAAAHRTLKVGAYADLLQAARQRFTDPAFRERYRHRGEQVETVFGFLRATLGYTRWFLRGDTRVAAEARLFKIAYQMRKVHSRMLPNQARPATAIC